LHFFPVKISNAIPADTDNGPTIIGNSCPSLSAIVPPTSDKNVMTKLQEEVPILQRLVNSVGFVEV